MPPLYQSAFILDLWYRYGVSKVVPDTIPPFFLSVNLCSSVFHSLCISSISSFDIFPGWGCFESISLQVHLSNSYQGNNCLKNPKIPMGMRISPHVLGFYSLVNSSFFDCEGFFPFCHMYTYKLSPILEKYELLQLEYSMVVFHNIYNCSKIWKEIFYCTFAQKHIINFFKLYILQITLLS